MKKGENPYDALSKFLAGKRIEYIDREPFIDTEQVKVFSGKARWTPSLNIALTEEMMTACLIE